MFTDIDAKSLLYLSPQEPAPVEPRRLVSGNVTNRETYIKELNKQLEAHNVHSRVGTLVTQAQSGYLTTAQKTEYNNLDDTITKAMMHAEKTLPNKRRTDWTVTLSKIVHGIRYYKLLLRYTRGERVSLHIIKKVAVKAGITHAPLEPEGIRTLLKQEWKRLTEYMEEAARKRDKSLEDFIKTGDKVTETKRLEALKQIKYREKSKRRYRRIRGVLQRLKNGGITHLDVPIHDRQHNIIG